jgi:hypothetical protein
VRGNWRINNVVFPEHHNKTICPLIISQSTIYSKSYLSLFQHVITTIVLHQSIPQMSRHLRVKHQAFGKGKDVLSHFIRGIRANTIAAIGTVAPGTSNVQYLFAPKIHHDLGGAPKSIVGNMRIF